MAAPKRKPSTAKAEAAEAADAASVNPALQTPRDAVKTLVTGFGYVEFPQVSPDGEKLLFNVVGDYETSQMFLTEAKGGKVRSLFSGETVTAETVKSHLQEHKGRIDEQGTWSHDGKKIFYRTNREGTFGIAEYRVKKGEDRMIAHDPGKNLKHPVELEDGFLVAYGGPPSEKYATVDRFTDLFKVAVETGETEQLTHSDGSISYKHPSQLGGRIIAHKESGEQADLVTIDPKTGRESNLTATQDAVERHPFYNEKRHLLAFHSDESGDKNLWISEKDGSRKVQLTFYGQAAQSPCWSPDGKKLYFIKKHEKPPEGQPFYERQVDVRVLKVEDALEDLAAQAKDIYKNLKEQGAPAEEVAAAEQRYRDYKHFLKRYA